MKISYNNKWVEVIIYMYIFDKLFTFYNTSDNSKTNKLIFRVCECRTSVGTLS